MQVQFKHVSRYYRLPAQLKDITIGEFVVVQSFVDKSQEDLGIITLMYGLEDFEMHRATEMQYEDPDEYKVGRVLRTASPDELKFLPMKFQREYPLFRICQTFAMRHSMPIVVKGAEYQFDGNVLFIYYESTERVDYRSLMKFLVKMYCPGSRVQMKNAFHCREFKPLEWAKEALISGKHPDTNSIILR